MAYNNAIPQANDRLKDSQPQLLENFATISALLGVNHVIDPWISPVDGNEGKHKWVSMPEQSSAPSTEVNEMALYTKESGGVANLFVRRENNGDELSLTSNSTNAFDGQITFPSGIIMKWGRTTGGALAGNNWTEITFSTPFPTSCYNIQLTPKVVTPQPSLNQTTSYVILDVDYNKTKFWVFNRRSDIGAPIAADCTWVAIGI